MRLKDFKEGQIIHRTKPYKYGEGSSSYSFIEDPITFIEVKSHLLFYKYTDNLGFDPKEVYRCYFDILDDNNWDLFPLKFLNEDGSADIVGLKEANHE